MKNDLFVKVAIDIYMDPTFYMVANTADKEESRWFRAWEGFCNELDIVVAGFMRFDRKIRICPIRDETNE